MSLGHMRPRVGVVTTLTLFVMSALLVLSAQAQAAPTGTMTLNVVSARDGGAGVHAGDPITTFKYIVNVDNTGTTSLKSPVAGSACDPTTPGFVDPPAPTHCPWTSIAGAPGSSPIATQGDQADFASPLSLPAGRYLISVLADGFKLDGAHLTVPDGGTVPVTVELQPTPLPDATVRALVFQDSAPVNSAPDLPAEQGLAGFEGQMTDYLGQIITDVYGNPLCTTYVGENPDTHVISPPPAGGVPVIDTIGGHCLSDSSGMLAIPHMGTNRYALSVIPPNGTNWVQTTTLEGNHDWDSWVMEGNTGFDTEFVAAGEPVPTAVFGFVKPTALAGSAPGEIKGVVDAMKIYVPTVGGLPGTGQIWGGLNGGKIDKPINRPWIALTDLLNGDQAVYVGRGNADGTFDIKNVPNGNYTITWWDEPQNYILDLKNVTVSGGQVEDLGILPLQEWWTQFQGHVFNDLNSNGKRDPGEPGVKDMTVAIKKRENSGMDRGNIGVTTAADGSYSMENVYPMTQWLVMEVYSDRYHTTGVTYQADNQPGPTTVLGAGVDISILPIIGLSGSIDWGVKPYPAGKNGGIVGTVSYDTTRNELDPRFAAVEPWQPGIPDLPVNLYAPVPCPSPQTDPATPCATTPAGDEYVLADDGSYAHGQLLNQYTTENWQRPGLNGDGNCVPRDVNGDPLPFGGGQLVTTKATDCLEGPLMGVQFQQGFSTVDGNYGFGDGCFGPGGFDTTAQACADHTDPTALTPDDYIVDVGIPDDARGKPLYKVTREEDINIGNGDQTVPQIPPPPCVGALHTVDVAGIAPDGPNATDNPTFVDIGGSPYEGQPKPLCNQKLVHVSDGRSIAPTFNMFTDVPVPARFWGLLVDDLNFSTDKKSLLYGEKAGIPNAPVGIYDYTNRLVATSESDFNGLFDVLLPSTNRINCPTPSGVCPNLYRFVGNDPGVPGRLNANYRPEFRTIAAEFEGFPGLLVPADLAPTQVGVTVQLPGGQTNHVSCVLDQATPQLMAVSKPFVRLSETDTDRTFVINGQGFGANGSVTLDNATVLPTSAWSDTQISVSVPTTTAPGAHQLNVGAANGQKTVNGLTFHVLGGGYTPNVYEVGPGKTYAPTNALPAAADHAIQRAIDDAASSPDDDLVVVYPGLATADNPRQNPRGAYYENLIVSKPLKLQGVGPGGIQTATNTTVPGSIIDGSAFGGDSPAATDWQAKIAGLQWDGNQNVNDGAVISIYARSNAFPLAPGDVPAIDGFDLRGGDQQGFPTNINQIGGGPTGLPGAIVTQGGAVFANAYARALHITNNVVQNNGGGYGTIRIGTPDLPAPNTSNHNENVVIAQNRVIDNAGTNLAGGIGVFAGADDYQIAGNDVCGNFSAEYGGGISAYGLNPNGTIHNNRIYFNRSYDEGGGIMIAGELPATPGALSPGSGPVTIEANQIQDNLANDDGGGIRFLMAGNFPMNVRNNMIVNNVSTHEGGGVALDDAPDVRFVNNTVMKNITTATALTSNGLPAPAGLSTGANSTQLQATLPAGSPTFSRPLLFNDIFWDNRAGTRTGSTVTGIGITGDASPVNHWDLGAADGSGLLTPTYSVLQVTTGTVAAPNNRLSDPNVVAPYDTSVDFAAWRTNPNFVGAILVATDLPPNLLGDYHLKDATSPAYDSGAASKNLGTLPVAAPATDFDGDHRPAFNGFDIGADEIPAIADLSITKTDGRTSVREGDGVSYTITVTNHGPANVVGATVTDNVPTDLKDPEWECAQCAPNQGSGPTVITTVNLGAGQSVVVQVRGEVKEARNRNFSVTLVNTATITAPPGITDPNAANNSATDTDAIINATRNGANLVTLGSRALQLGMRGPDVMELQRILRNFGFAIAINGAFGPRTQQAVKDLQRRFKLRATGVVDKALVRRLGTGPRLGSRVLRLGMRGSDVTQLQRILRRRGRAVTVNGSFGPRTRRAVMAQQQRFGLRATGVAGGTFVKRLGK